MSETSQRAGARYAAIDIGSNTVKLTIVDVGPDGTLTPIFDGGMTTRIGEGMQSRLLGETPMRRTLDALKQCLGMCAEHGCKAVYAVGTSALRDAANRDEFLNRAGAIGLPITVLSGDEEARLSSLAVRSDPRWRDARRLVVLDIGGGSTELTFSEEGESGRRPISLQLGAVRLTEGCLRSDPPTEDECRDALDAARRTFSDALIEPVGRTATLVGVGGTVINMAAVAHAGRHDDLAHLHGMELHSHEVERQIELYAGLTVQERRAIPGLDPARADVILGGAIILRAAMEAVGAEQVSVSCRGLRWGVLYERLTGCGGQGTHGR